MIWTEEEINIIKKKYATTTNRELLKLLPGRNEQQLWHIASKLNIHKDKDTISKCLSVPRNLEYKITQYYRGETYTNSRGDIYVYKPDILEKKPRNYRKYRRGNYVALKLLVAEEKLGRQIKEDEKIRFYDGNNTNITKDNIYIEKRMRKDVTKEDILKLREKGMNVKDIIKKLGITNNTYYRKLRHE